MRFDIFTIFPGMFDGPFGESIIKRAIEREIIEIHVHDIRDFTTDRHRSVDDTPYGGGPGMVMMAEPIFAAVESALGDELDDTTITLMSASGHQFNHAIATQLAELDHIALICGRYEGIDQRVIDHLVDLELSIGDYVLSGGELAAAVVVDAVTRLLPGVIEAESLAEESHSNGLLEYPQYTRPAEFRGWRVPEVLVSGHHGRIEEWRLEKSIEKTRHVRPDLIEKRERNPVSGSDCNGKAQ